jgi:murein DD-endopeptidase
LIIGRRVFCCIFLLFFGCAVPYQPSGNIGVYSVSVGEKAAETALSMVGTPYRYKGDSPAGFDCSGLVRYSYLTAGMNVPHSTSALRRRTQPVSRWNLRKGDLVFFDQSGKKYSHVGIYEGSGRFVHAPSSGKRVRVDNLNDPYWKKHFLGARRFS